MATPQKIADTDPPPQGNDHMEQKAAEIADRDGKRKVSDEDREQAYEELQSTAPPPAEKASH